MKKILGFSLITALALCLSQTAHGQGNPEAAKLAREGAEAAKDNDWDKAVNAFRKAADLDRKHAKNLSAVLQQRAVAYMSQQQFPEAIADFSEALKITPKDPSIYERRAYVEMKLNDLDKALADYSEAIKLNPDEVRYYLLRSYIFESKGDLKNSMADTEKVLKLDKGNAEAQSRKARLQARLSQATPSPPAAGNPPQPVPVPTKRP